MGCPSFLHEAGGNRRFVNRILPTQQTLVAVVHAMQQVGKMMQTLFDAKLAHVMRRSFGAQAGVLFVVLFDVSLFVPRFEAKALLAGALDASPRCDWRAAVDVGTSGQSHAAGRSRVLGPTNAQTMRSTGRLHER